MALVGMPSLPAGADGFTTLEPDGDGRYRPMYHESSGAGEVADIDSITPPVLSPDGSKIAFSSALGDESLGLYALFIANTDGTGLTQVTAGSYGEFDPAWSPDGTQLFFSQNSTGSIIASTCCRIAKVDIASGLVTPLTVFNGSQRPERAPSGSLIVFDNPSGIFTMSSSGGAATLRVDNGFDASFSPDASRLVFIVDDGSTRSIRTIHIGGSTVTNRYTTTRRLENPVWRGGHIVFLEFSGVGYDGRSAVEVRSLNISTGVVKVLANLPGTSVGISSFDNDEMFFYSSDGSFEYNDVSAGGVLSSPILEGSGYTSGWDTITSVDLDGDGQDEMFFYRDDGLFRYYNVSADGSLGSPILEGSGYTSGWDTITSVDLDGDGQDEMFFYRDDGLFRYYHINPDGTLPQPLLAGTGYTRRWDTITSVDLEGDGQDEMFFYRRDGLFRYYHIRADATLPSPLLAEANYTPGWDSIAGLDLEGDGQDEMFFYRSDGLYRFYDVNADGSLPAPLLAGDDFETSWDIFSPVNLHDIPG